MDSISLVHNYVAWKNGVRIVNDKLVIVQGGVRPTLAIHTVKPLRGPLELHVVLLQNILVSRAHATEQHSPVVAEPLSVIVALGRIWSKIESVTKSLEVDVLTYAPAIKSTFAYPAYPTTFNIAHGLGVGDVTHQHRPMIVFLHNLGCELLPVSFPPLFQLFVTDNKHEAQSWAGSFLLCPCLLEFPTDLLEFL